MNGGFYGVVSGSLTAQHRLMLTWRTGPHRDDQEVTDEVSGLPVTVLISASSSCEEEAAQADLGALL